MKALILIDIKIGTKMQKTKFQKQKKNYWKKGC
jgi:hypothetical protein